MIAQTLHAPRILVIDDDPINVRVLHELLKSHYRVSWATDGQKGLNFALDTLPDLILLDILMPGMDGFEVCRQLREDSFANRIPVIFLTTNADPESQEHCLTAGGDDFVTKPFVLSELLLRVKFHLAQQEQG